MTRHENDPNVPNDPNVQNDSNDPNDYLMQVTSDQIFGTFTFSIDIGLQVRLREEPGQVEIRLEADVNGER